MRRRDALVFGGIAAVAISIPPILRRLPQDFDFQPVSGVDGFRRISGGAASGLASPFAGLEPEGFPSNGQADLREVNICRDLYGPSGWTDVQLPIAVFSDFNCPYCRRFETQLTDMAAADPNVRLVWHEYPLLGEYSLRAARAMIAAANLGYDSAGRDYMWTRSLPPGPVGLQRMASALGLDPEAFRREAQGARVNEELEKNLALGRLFALPGTPGMVVGRTVVVGAMKPADLRKLIALERDAPRTVCI